MLLGVFDKLLKPKAGFKASKKKKSSLRGHSITSISTLYQVKFRVRKFVPSANPPYNQDHLLSGRFISGIECRNNYGAHFRGENEHMKAIKQTQLPNIFARALILINASKCPVGFDH